MPLAKSTACGLDFTEFRVVALSTVNGTLFMSIMGSLATLLAAGYYFVVMPTLTTHIVGLCRLRSIASDPVCKCPALVLQLDVLIQFYALLRDDGN